MRGDFSRDSFDPLKPFSRVLMQQGRVQLDADWNEQTSLTLEYVRMFARDFLGRGAGPVQDCGFRIATRADLRAPKRGADPFTPKGRAALNNYKNALVNGDLLLVSGRYYVGGVPVELREAMLYSEQAGYPFDSATHVEALQADGVSWMAYLDVWEEFISADEDESILDPALGGADTCGRGLIRWQVRILNSPNGTDDFETFVGHQRGRLSAYTEPRERPGASGDSASGAGYRGIENRLYRVEIHQGSDGAGEGVSFKWSRDNGSRACAVERMDGNEVRLEGRDGLGRLALASAVWVELSNDCWTGRDPAGALARVADLKSDERTVILDWANPRPVLPAQCGMPDARRSVLRRWDHIGQVGKNRGAIAVEQGVDIELDDGVFIRFEPGGRYRTGDYWLIPARTLTRDILWPRTAGHPQVEEPHGPVHHYAPLAMFRNGQLEDLRKTFGPISFPV